LKRLHEHDGNPCGPNLNTIVNVAAIDDQNAAFWHVEILRDGYVGHLAGPSSRKAFSGGHRVRKSPALDMQPYGCILCRAMDAVFKALADGNRRKLLDELRKDNGQTLSELCGHLEMTRQAVTKHLLLLEEANLVATVWRGREKLHFLNPVPLHEISERWIAKYERHRLQALSDLKRGLEQNQNKKG